MTLAVFIGTREVFDPEMPETQFKSIVRTFVNVDKSYLRGVMEKNKSLNAFINSSRFMLEYARLTDQMDAIPSPAWIAEDERLGGFRIDGKQYRFNLREILFDHTRHGLRRVDIPMEPVHGVHQVPDVTGCSAPPEPLRNMLVVQNMNIPILRFDPSMFLEPWVLCMLRPKFVLRGMIACPKGDYGVAKIGLELGDRHNRPHRVDYPIAFRETEEHGEWLTFELETPDYDFRPSSMYVYLMVFHVNRTQSARPGFRVANWSLQASIDAEPFPLPASRYETIPVDGPDGPDHNVPFRFQTDCDTVASLQHLRDAFFSVVTNVTTLRDEKHARAEADVERMFEQSLLDDRMDEGVSTPSVGDKRLFEVTKAIGVVTESDVDTEKCDDDESDEWLEPVPKRQK